MNARWKDCMMMSSTRYFAPITIDGSRTCEMEVSMPIEHILCNPSSQTSFPQAGKIEQ